MTTFCTIINQQYLPYAKVLYGSLVKTDPQIRLQVLVSDCDDVSVIPTTSPNLVYHSISSVLTTPIARAIQKKYAVVNNDLFRWSLKPVFILHLLSQNFSKVIFTDPDVFFTGDYTFIFDNLDNHPVLLTPQWGDLNPLENEDGLFTVLRNGIFSAAFIAASKDAIPLMQWWAGVCHYKMEKRKDLGLYDDQKYLDLFQIIDGNVGVLRHQGCNLANICIQTCRREMINGKLMINKIYEPIFIHFTKDTITNILNGNDPLLSPYLQQYGKELKKAGTDTLAADQLSSSFFTTVKKKLLLRTRLKKFLFKLAEKL